MRRLSIVVFVFALALANERKLTAQQAAQAQPEPTWVLGSGRWLALFPSGDIYPVYTADPHRPTNVIQETFIVGGSLQDTQSPLTHLSAGGRFGILRIGSAQAADRSWQVSIEAGLDAVFDSQNRLDAVGWDGNYGLTVTTNTLGPLALKFAVLHVSGHLGDEYQDRTGRPRINYTREELSVGATWGWSPRWRAYAESGVGYRRGSPLLEPWRVQWGVEYESMAERRVGRYVAIDFSSMQERQWRVDTSIEGGIVLSRAGRTSRLLLQWHDGRPTTSEFFRDSIMTLSIALRVDL